MSSRAQTDTTTTHHVINTPKTSLFLIQPLKPENITNPAPPEVFPLLHEFVEVFHPPTGLPPCRNIAHSIDLIPSATLANAPAYCLEPKEATEIEREIGQLLDFGHIQPSSSPCASPTFIIPKKDTSEWRLVTDYRALNKATIKNRYPLPWIKDLLDHMQGASFFTNTDMDSGYHLVCMQHSDIWKTTFKTKFGLYEWLAMPFGLTNAPATFMHLINDIFRPHLSKFVVICLDDIFIFSISWEDRLQHMCTVLALLRQHQLQVKEKKSYFSQSSIHYLGFIVDSTGVRLDPA
jgi:hypothetical protein